MAVTENKQTIRDKDGDEQEERKKSLKEFKGPGQGRKTIFILFFVTVGISVLLWFQANFSEWIGSFFGPSSWTFSR